MTTYVPDKLQEIAPYNSTNWYLVVFYGALFFMELIITNRKGEKFTVLYDECDHELVSKYKWCVNGSGYAMTSISIGGGKYRHILMHRMILNIADRFIFGDHINHNKIDNRRCNIRACTPSQNQMNRKPHGASKYIGVNIKHNTINGRRTGPYIRACIQVDGVEKILGYFKTEEDAARARDIKAKELFGEFANLNFKDDN